MTKDMLLDATRISVLHDLEILDTPDEIAYDDIARLASVCCQSPVAAINFVDGTRHWTKAIVGINGGQGTSVSADLSFCAETVCTPGGILSIPDALADERWRTHPMVSDFASIRFYYGASIIVFGEPVGVVCVFGDESIELSEDQKLALVALARQTSALLELRKHNAQLRDLAVTDHLTGLANRRLLLDRLEIAIAQSHRSGGSIGVLYCDVDNFKSVNDRWGHAAGDRLLCHIAAGLRAATREIDTVARMAGDEFVVVCPGLREPDDLKLIVGRITRVLASTDSLEDGLVPPHLTIGAAFLGDCETATSVLQRADEAMYSLKSKRFAA